MMPVEIGISNDTYVEITSGLSEGEIVILPQLTASSSSSNTSSSGGMNFGGMGSSLGGGFGGNMGGPQDRQYSGSGSGTKNSSSKN